MHFATLPLRPADIGAVCGILGIVASAGRVPSVTDQQARKLRDLMAHRGPDGAGLWRDGNALLGHRRLAILDLTEAGAQPMSTPGGRFTIVYNGELYNEPQVRAQLGAEGVRVVSTCDTETVLLALATWGAAALERFRGMYSLGLFDRQKQTLLLAVDPFAIKPLHWALTPAHGGTGGQELVFASEIEPVVRHPGMAIRPDPVVVSSYLTTIRTTLGDRTMLSGVRVLTPGQRLLFDLRASDLRWKTWQAPAVAPALPPADAAAQLREALEDSVRAHLRSDAPICMLLSGGLDSAAIAHCAAGAGARLDTYCSGAAGDDAAGAADDFHFARMIAGEVGARHVEAPVARAMFTARWREMVERTGQPLGTPNEVAINEVARALRADGHAAALSGEGADELLAGYAGPLRLAAAYLSAGGDDPGLFQLASCAWIPLEAKADVLQDDVWRAAERDETLIAHYRDEYTAAAAEPGAGDAMEATLRFHRRINLTGLLRRLDSATMLASVEGRAPFADREVASLCGAIPMSGKLSLRDGAVETKIALRRAMAGRLPQPILTRPKASFPLPFEGWLDDLADILRHPGPALDLLRPKAIEAAANRPSAHWQRAWPVMNLVLWAKRWWG
jgi:asparagine synthase (glutamine-hydrolysing)